MGIDRYELNGIAFHRADGPMWRTQSVSGEAALLTLHTQSDADTHLERWKRWAQVECPHVVRLYDVISHEDGRWALIQEEAQGDTLALLIERGDEVLRTYSDEIIEGIEKGLAQLHNVGITHGDLTPSNIIITPEGRPVIIDLIGKVKGECGTPRWNDGSCTPQDDRQAVAHIIDALEKAAQGETVHLPIGDNSPGTRLRAHSELPVTQRVEKRTVFASFRPIRIIAAALGICSLLVILGPIGLGIFGERTALAEAPNAHASLSAAQSEGTNFVKSDEQSQSALRPASTPQQADREQSVYAREATQIQQSVVPTDCTNPEMLQGRLEEILKARDAAYNHHNAQGLEHYVGGAILESDTQTIDQMNAQGTTISQFLTRMSGLKIRSCTTQTVTVEADLRAQSYEVCQADQCQQAQGNPDTPNIVTLTFEGVDRLLTDVTQTEAGASQ